MTNKTKTEIGTGADVVSALDSLPTKVHVLLIDSATGIPKKLPGTRATKAPVTDENTGACKCPISEEMKKHIFPFLIAGWGENVEVSTRIKMEKDYLSTVNVKLVAGERNTIKLFDAQGNPNPKGILDYHILMQHEWDIARTHASIKDKPWSTWVIVNEEEEQKHKVSNGKVKATAFDVIRNLKTRQERMDFLKLMGDSVYDMTPDAIEATLYDYAEQMPMQIIALGKDEAKTRTEKLLIYDALAFKVLTNENGIYFNNKYLGIDTEDAVKFLKDKSNQDIKQSLFAVVETKREQNPID